MADFALDVDWVSRVSSWVDKSPSFGAGNDYLATVTSGPSASINATAVSSEYTSQTWTTATIYYKMQGMDQITAGLYATWVVTGTPDLAAGKYSGGLNLPLRDVHVIASWTF